MADFKFEKKFRLLSAKDFEELKSGSSSYKKASVIIYYKKNSYNLSRIGISASKKLGKAHDRNRIKRLIREHFRLSPYKYLGFDILFVVSWARSLSGLSDAEKEVILMKNLNEYFNFLEDSYLRSK